MQRTIPTRVGKLGHLRPANDGRAMRNTADAAGVCPYAKSRKPCVTQGRWCAVWRVRKAAQDGAFIMYWKKKPMPAREGIGFQVPLPAARALGIDALGRGTGFRELVHDVRADFPRAQALETDALGRGIGFPELVHDEQEVEQRETAVKIEAPACGNGFPEPLRRVRASSTDAEEAGGRIFGWESTGRRPREVPAAGTRIGTGVKGGELSRKGPQAGTTGRNRFLLDCRENGARLSPDAGQTVPPLASIRPHVRVSESL
jgi:hypothetical protein